MRIRPTLNPATFQVVRRLRVGQIPHHATPSSDLRRLYVDNEGSSSLTVLDARTGRPIRPIRVPFPYNLFQRAREWSTRAHRRPAAKCVCGGP
jgi:DNA-binding beta-propeller fold protein YncE